MKISNSKNEKGHWVATSRKHLWDKEKQRNYWSEKELDSRKAKERRHGEHTAKAIDRIWKELTDDEKSIIEFLILSKRNTFIAKYEDDLFISLTSKGLLQVPPGVGTQFMQKMETAYSIPSPVWTVLSRDHNRFFPKASGATNKRIAILEEQIGFRIEKLIR